MWRNVGVMAFIIGIPVVQICLFSVSIGHDPVGLRIAITNDELNGTINPLDPCPAYTGCNNTMLSCRYLQHLSTKHHIITFYETQEEANEQVERGWAWASIYFKYNFSDSLIKRSKEGEGTNNWELEASNVDVRLDMSNQHIGTLLFRDIQFSFNDFMMDILEACDVNSKVGTTPLRIHDPVYGDKEPQMTDFATPGVILSTIFFLAVALTAGAMLIEKNQGTMERSLVTGITGTEILLSHVVTQFLIMSGQVFLVLVFSFGVFQLTCRGAMVWVAIMSLLAGLCGMCFGFLISCTSENERTATYMGMGSLLPVVMLCGVIWPVEGMYEVVKIIAYILPLTKPTEALRSILQRGFSITSTEVYVAYMVLSSWCAVFLAVSIIALKLNKGGT